MVQHLFRDVHKVEKYYVWDSKHANVWQGEMITGPTSTERVCYFVFPI